jgi:hypothetical protein
VDVTFPTQVRSYLTAAYQGSNVTLLERGYLSGFRLADSCAKNRFFLRCSPKGCRLLCITGVTVLVSILLRRLALIVLLATTLTCYFGASSWLVYYLGCGSSGELIYGIIFSIVLVKLGLDTQDKSSLKN